MLPVALLLVGGARWNATQHSQVLAELGREAERQGLALTAEQRSGYLGTARLHHATLVVSPSAKFEAEHVEVGYLPWRRFIRVRGSKLLLSGPLSTSWEDLHRVQWPPGVEVDAAQVSYEAPRLGAVSLADARYEATPAGDKIHTSALSFGGFSLADVSMVGARPHTTIRFKFGADPSDPRATELGFIPSTGQAFEWALTLPSQPFPEFADRAGFRAADDWDSATIAGTGSLLVPEASNLHPRANLRFVIDRWHQPAWPQASAVTGASGAIALRLTPTATTRSWTVRAEVEAGLFSLVGAGELSVEEGARLTFRASGTRTCAELAQRWTESVYRDTVRAELERRVGGAAENEVVRLTLEVNLEPARAPQLDFRWHLDQGCGLSELKEPQLPSQPQSLRSHF